MPPYFNCYIFSEQNVDLIKIYTCKIQELEAEVTRQKFSTGLKGMNRLTTESFNMVASSNLGELPFVDPCCLLLLWFL